MMDAAALRRGRYLLYLDVLGFKNLVSNGRAQDVYGTIDSTIQAGQPWKNVDFGLISFSDTIVLYQVPVGWGSWAFSDVYAMSGITWSALLAKGIPVRGAIAFGEFLVERDSSGQHEVFFGNALIEAYEAEKREPWVGIVVCPSASGAVEAMDPGRIDVLASENRWIRRHDGTLLLNPFIKLEGWYWHDQIGEVAGPYEAWDSPHFPNELRAFRWLMDTAERIEQGTNPDSQIVEKYRNTVAFLRKVIPPECWHWADQISREMKSPSEDENTKQ